jgi:uncharacterized protein (DUF1810 family)
MARHDGGMTGDPFSLQRFVDAQDSGGTYERAIGELRAGRKTSHWMWFIFPQIAGLGHSAISRQYSISSLAEAKAYLAHPVLGPRLVQCARLVTQVPGEVSAAQVFGGVDALKLRSSMTLFLRAGAADPALREVLDRFFGGEPDAATEDLLDSAG